MSIKKGIGYSPLTDKVYLGKQNKEKRMWVGEKEDITNDFLAVSSEFFEVNTIRSISCSNGDKNLFINIKEDEESLIKIIEALNNSLKELKK